MRACGLALFYFDIENLALWTRSGIDGYAEEITSGVLESWSTGVLEKDRAPIVAKKLVLRIKSLLRQVSSHYSTTPLLQYSLLGPIKQSPFRGNQSRALWTRIFTMQLLAIHTDDEDHRDVVRRSPCRFQAFSGFHALMVYPFPAINVSGHYGNN